MKILKRSQVNRFIPGEKLGVMAVETKNGKLHPVYFDANGRFIRIDKEKLYIIIGITY